MTVALLGFCHRYSAPLGPTALGWARVDPGPGPGPAAGPDLGPSPVHGPSAGPRVWWVADRGADRLLELDAELLVRRSLELAAPVAVASSSDGWSWVVSARQSGPAGLHRLVRLDPSGFAVLEWDLPPVRGLQISPAGDALVLAGLGQEGALWRGRGTGEFELLAELPGAMAMATRGWLTLVAQESGELRVLSGHRDPAPLAMTVLEGRPLGVAAGPDAGWWVLEMRWMGARVLSLDRDLEMRHATPVDVARPVLAGGATEGGVWVLDLDRGRVLRLAPVSGGIVQDVELPVRACVAGWSTSDGGVLVASPGALLRLDSEGRVTSGQGGFAHLAAVGR